MALQSDGKIVMVGGSITDFVLARYNTDGSLDEDFGIGGRVTTPLASGIREEVARAVAIQRDGKIVVAGHLSSKDVRPGIVSTSHSSLRRRTARSMTTFGIDGLALSNVKGRAFAVAIQAGRQDRRRRRFALCSRTSWSRATTPTARSTKVSPTSVSGSPT